MIKENQELFNRLHVFSDAVLVFLSMLSAYWVRFSLFKGIESIPFRYYVDLGVIAAALCLVTFEFFELYVSFRTVRFHREAGKLLTANLLVTLILQAGLYVFHLENLSRGALVFFFLFSSFLLLGKRAWMRTFLRRYRTLGFNLKRVLIVGDGRMARLYFKIIRRDKKLGLSACGYVADGSDWRELPCLGGYSDLEDVMERTAPDEVVAAVPSEDAEWMRNVIAACEKAGIKVSIIPYYAAYMSSNPQIDNVDGLPLINLRRIPLDNMGNAFVKRAMDIAGSLLLIVLTSPLMLLAIIGVKLSSPGPVIFKQERVGKGKKTFFMYKFRSMRVNDGEQTAWSRDQDPRKTRFGALIRKFSIDELPQLFNVLKGDMSLVGPRPEIPFYVEQFKEEIPRYMVKHQVRPGITGWAQVNGFRGDTSIRGRIECDIYYIENWSVLFDVRILVMTLFRAVNSEQLG